MTNPYVQYYLDQQQGQGMSVFRGSQWQRGHGQVGYGLGGVFRSIARAVTPFLKSGAKTMGNIALNSGANFLGDVLAGKNVKESAKARAKEAANVAKKKAVDKLQTLTQTGNGKRAGRSPKQTAKKRKASTSTVRSRQTKKRKTAPDIFG